MNRIQVNNCKHKRQIIIHVFQGPKYNIITSKPFPICKFRIFEQSPWALTLAMRPFPSEYCCLLWVWMSRSLASGGAAELHSGFAEDFMPLLPSQAPGFSLHTSCYGLVMRCPPEAPVWMQACWEVKWLDCEACDLISSSAFEWTAWVVRVGR